MRRSETPPAGLVYREDFLSPAEENELVTAIGVLTFREVRMRGVVAKRRVVHFGWDYGYESWRIEPTEPIPTFLLPLRARCAAAAAVAPDEFAQLLVACYPTGAGIGWHRDAPMFGPVVAGVSLGAAGVLRFRRTLAGARQRYSLTLRPRSLSLLTGAARSAWQHSVPPVPALRYSVTFRQVKTSVPRQPPQD